MLYKFATQVAVKTMDTKSTNGGLFGALSNGKSFADIKVKEAKISISDLVKLTRCSAPGATQAYARIAWAGVRKGGVLTQAFACVKYPSKRGVKTDVLVLTPDGAIREPHTDGYADPTVPLDDQQLVKGVTYLTFSQEGTPLASTSIVLWDRESKREKLVAAKTAPCFLVHDPEEGDELLTLLPYLNFVKVGEGETPPNFPGGLDGVFNQVQDLIAADRKAYLEKSK